MTTAIPELIALELITRLEQITTANGYAFSVPSVQRINRDATNWTATAYSIVVVQGDDERNPDHDRPGNPPANAYAVKFQVIGFIRQSDRSTDADQALVNDMNASIRKAIAENSSTWHTFDGNAYNADMGTGVNVLGDVGDYAASAVELTVWYRVNELDPYEVRA